MPFCPKCGSSINQFDSFCFECGARIEVTATPNQHARGATQETRSPFPDARRYTSRNSNDVPPSNQRTIDQTSNTGRRTNSAAGSSRPTETYSQYSNSTSSYPSRVPRGLNDTWKICFSKYVDGRGRASRKEYWLWHLNLLIVFLPFGIILGAAAASGEEVAISVVGIVGGLGLLLTYGPPSISLYVRRLHDLNWSGWLVLLLLLFDFILGPLSLILYIVLGCLLGTDGDNKYGAKPE